MKLAAWACLAGVVACGGASSAPPPVSAAGATQPTASSSGSSAVIVESLAPVAPDVEIRDATSALVGATGMTFDGIEEGLAWPSLAKAAPKKPTIAITVARDVPVKTVLRAVWTLRDADVRLQTPDAAGVVRVLDLAPKPARPTRGCHLAAFVGTDGAIRIAAPGGPRVVTSGDDLAHALEAEDGVSPAPPSGEQPARVTCPLRYVAFGAEDPHAKWGSVFDVAWVVARGKSAGDARIVLAEPIHDTSK